MTFFDKNLTLPRNWKATASKVSNIYVRNAGHPYKRAPQNLLCSYYLCDFGELVSTGVASNCRADTRLFISLYLILSNPKTTWRGLLQVTILREAK